MQEYVFNRKKTHIKGFLTSLVFVCSCLASLAQSSDLVDSLFTKRLNSLKFNIELPYNDVVGNDIYLFTHQGIPFAAKHLGNFLPKKEYIDTALKAAKLPQEFQYLPLALMQRTYINENRAGFWQLPYIVAIKYGLEITDEIDERLDIKKSTDAAIAYLQKLSEKYSNLWDVIIAYANSSSALESAKIRTSQDADIWVLYKQGYLPNKHIIPDFITSTYLVNFYQSHHIKPSEPEEIQENFAEIPRREVAVTPAQTRPNPSGNNAKNTTIEKKDEKKKVTYTVKSGDTLTKVAKKYNVTIANIQKWNNLKNDRINIGQKLIIYH